MEERQPPPSRDGTVVLDIGGGMGALVLHVTEALLGREIEIKPMGPSGRRIHSAVRERQLGGRAVFAAVYPQVAAGDYVIGGTGERVTIIGGRIAEVQFTEVEVTEDQVIEDQITEEQITGRHITGRRITEGRITEGSTTEGSTTEGSTTEGRTTEGRITEGRITEGRRDELQHLHDG